MSGIKILVEGYVREEGGFFASPSTVLIKDSGSNILVDPGTNEKMLLDALKKENLSPEDIDILFITHYHPDHVLNIRLFPNVDVYDGCTIYRGDKETEYSGNLPNTNIQVISTPGHADEHCSLLVEIEKGKVAIAGDVFWWVNNEEQKTDKESLLGHEDTYANNMDTLKESRKKVLEPADFIIPGHGKMFKVNKL